MAKAHDRILQLGTTMNAAADTLVVNTIDYFRDRGKVGAAGTGFIFTFTQNGAGTSPSEVEVGELLPPATHLRFVFAAF